MVITGDTWLMTYENLSRLLQQDLSTDQLPFLMSN